MKRVHVLVEGQTEETFVRQVLVPHLSPHGIHLTAIVIATKRAKGGGKFRGGIVSFSQIRRELRLLLADRAAHAVTTMIDLYGLPSDSPGLDRKPLHPGAAERVRLVERAFEEEIDHHRFLPYFSLHEFEALLLAEPGTIERTLGHQGIASNLAQAVAAAGSPEDVNDGANTHPSARISRLATNYRKALHGPLVAQRIGLERMRSQCQHFSAWLRQLESLAQ